MSGKYDQGEGCLRLGNTFCCLGVLKDVNDPEDDSYRLYNEEKNGWISIEKFGLSHEVQKGLAELNNYHVPFEIIAGFNQENL